MAHTHSSLANGWEDTESLRSSNPPLPTAHGGNRRGIPPGVQQGLEDVFAMDLPLSEEDLDAIAYRSILDVEKMRTRFHRNQDAMSWVDSSMHPHHHPIEYYSTNATSSLGPLGPNSVQNDVQHNSGWIDSKSESVADSGFFSNPSIGSSGLQYVDGISYPAPDNPYHVATDPSLDIQTGQFQSGSLLDISSPYFPGCRSELYQQATPETIDYSVNPTLDPSAGGQAYHHYAREYQEEVKVESVCESLRPCTVSSEAIGSVRSRTKHTNFKSSGDITTCRHCGAQFTGRYRNGNCSRHVRQLHSDKSTQLSSDCICRICKKSFNRQDARRKHEWKKHQLHDTKPTSRRQAPTQEDASSYAGTYDTPSDQGTLTYTHTLIEEGTVEHFRQPTTPQCARETFARARAELSDDMFDKYCEIFLTRCGQIVEDLQNKESNLYYIFNQALHDLSVQILPQYRILDFNAMSVGPMVDADNDTKHASNPGLDVPRNNGKAPVKRRISAASSIGPYAGRPSKKSSADPLVAIAESFLKPDSEKLDCPIHKFHLMNADRSRLPPSPCKTGCGKQYMNGVRQHLLPSYSPQHQGIISFIQRCANCKEDIINQDVWNAEGHITKKDDENRRARCAANNQAQGSNLICWARLYLKIYPRESRVPSPYQNDHRWLPDDLVASLRHDLQLPVPSSSNRSQAALLSSSNTGIQQPTPIALQNLSHATSPQWYEYSPEQIVPYEILVSRASRLLAQLLAYGHIEAAQQAAQEHPAAEIVETEYYTRITEVRQRPLTQMQHQQPNPQLVIREASPQLSTIHQAQGPIIGGADFTLPHLEYENTLGMNPVLGSDMGTQPSSQDYHGDPSFGPSFVGSSRTSYDFGSLSLMDTSQDDTTTPFHPMPDCPPSLSPYDTNLDMPGSSRTPQPPVAQIMSEIDQTMDLSPAESYYPPPFYMSADMDDTALSDVD